MLGYWVTCGVNIISWRHGWGWQPPQIASNIHMNMRHIQSVWAHWYAVHWCMVKALHSYIHSTWLRCWGTGSLVESKWYHYVMVEADSHLRLLPTSLWDIYKVFEYIDMLSIDIWLKPYTDITTLLGSNVGVLGHLRSQNNVITSWLRLTATPNYL